MPPMRPAIVLHRHVRIAASTVVRRSGLAAALVMAVALLGACGVARYGDSAAETSTTDPDGGVEADVTTTASPSTSTIPLSGTTVNRQATEDISEPSDTAVSIDTTSPYCTIARTWAETDPTLADSYDPSDPAMLEAAFRATADEKRRLAEVSPPEIAADLALVSTYWERVIEVFAGAEWDYARLFRRPDAETTAAVQGDRATQNAVVRINEHDARTCGLG